MVLAKAPKTGEKERYAEEAKALGFSGSTGRSLNEKLDSVWLAKDQKKWVFFGR